MIEAMHSDKQSPRKPPTEQTKLRTTTTVPLERREIVIRPPRGWLRISIAAAEVAFVSWAVPVACALLVFLVTASNPWMLEADWNSAIGVGADAWALSYFSPIDIAGAQLDLVPLGVTVLHVFLARIGLARSKAESWQGAAFFIPAYVMAVAVLAILSHHGAHIGWTLLGAATIALVAWVTSFRRWNVNPRWWERSRVYRHGIVDGIVGTLIIAVLGAGVLVTGTVSAWLRVLSIQELLNASVIDVIAIWVAQVMFLPNILAAASAWLTGPGFYVGIDAVHTPSTAPMEPIPAIPILGALPHTAIGIWVVAIPIVVGAGASIYFIKRRMEDYFPDQLAHAATTLVTTLVLTTTWMWLSTGGVWGGRMSLLGPRWAFAGVLSSIEVVGVAMLIYGLAHPGVRSRLREREGGPAAPSSLSHNAKDEGDSFPTGDLQAQARAPITFQDKDDDEAVVDLPLPAIDSDTAEQGTSGGPGADGEIMAQAVVDTEDEEASASVTSAHSAPEADSSVAEDSEVDDEPTSAGQGVRRYGNVENNTRGE